MISRPAGFALVACLLSLTPQDAFAKCRKAPFNFNFGVETATTMELYDGEPCSINIRAGSRTILYGVTVSTKPQHGSAGTNDRYSIAYVPQAGYRGSDVFVFTVIGDMGSMGKGTASVRVNVIVH